MSGKTNLFYKSIKHFGITVVLMFLGPIAIYEAFKNEGHPMYWPVLSTGILISIAAVAMLYYSLKLMMKAIFGEKK